MFDGSPANQLISTLYPAFASWRMVAAGASVPASGSCAVAVGAVHTVLVSHFPAVPGARNVNELPDAVVLL